MSFNAGAGALIGSTLGGGSTWPYPVSLMIPFMSAQSESLAYSFGMDYEVGKRTIKSLPSEMFNKIRAGSTDEITVVYMGKDYKMTYADYLPFLKKQHMLQTITAFRESLPHFSSLQNDIIEQMVSLEEKKAFKKPEELAKVITATLTGTKQIEQDTQEWIVNMILKILGLPTVNLPDVESPFNPPQTPSPVPPPPEPEPKEPIPPPPEADTYYFSFRYDKHYMLSDGTCGKIQNSEVFTGGQMSKVQIREKIQQFFDIYQNETRKCYKSQWGSRYINANKIYNQYFGTWFTPKT